MAKTSKPRKFESRKKKVAQYKQDVRWAIIELVYETLQLGGIDKKRARKIALQAGREELNVILLTCKEILLREEHAKAEETKEETVTRLAAKE